MNAYHVFGILVCPNTLKLTGGTTASGNLIGDMNRQFEYIDQYRLSWISCMGGI